MRNEASAKSAGRKRDAVQGQIPFHRLMHAGHGLADQDIQAAPDLAFPTGHGIDIRPHRRIALTFGNLGIAAGQQAGAAVAMDTDVAVVFLLAKTCLPDMDWPAPEWRSPLLVSIHPPSACSLLPTEPPVMTTDTRTARERCRAIFGNPAAPVHVWEHEFDYNDAALHAVAKKDWRDISVDDLVRYYQLNLVYIDPLQPELFHYLFPLYLASWHESLMNNTGPVFDDWHRVIGRTYLFETMMTPQQAQAVKAFITDSLLERLDRERGFVYAHSQTPSYIWFGEINDLGGSLPSIATLLDRWWAADTPGKAAAAIMFASGLIYESDDNPLFGAWTRERGGGVPSLTQASTADWLPENLQALRHRLTVDQLLALIDLSVQRLRHEPEFEQATRIAADAQASRETIEIQIDDLLDNLARQSQI